MKSVYFLITHYDADRTALLGMRLLALYRPRFYQDLLDLHIILLTTGTSLEPGSGEDVFVRIPNTGHHEGDLEMLNAGVAIALARGADVIIKLSQTRVFLNGAKLHSLVRMLLNSGKGAMGDHWCNRRQVSTDVLLMKNTFAMRLFPLPVVHGNVFAEQLLGKEIREKGLWPELLIHNYRQPIHDQEGRRRTRFYENLELLTNHDQHLRDFITEHYPRYLTLLDGSDNDTTGGWYRYGFDSLRMEKNAAFVLEQQDECYTLQAPGFDEVCHLNPSAALVWLYCEPDVTVGDIKKSLASEFGTPTREVHADIQATLEDFLCRRIISIVLPEEDTADHDDSTVYVDAFGENAAAVNRQAAVSPKT